MLAAWTVVFGVLEKTANGVTPIVTAVAIAINFLFIFNVLHIPFDNFSFYYTQDCSSVNLSQMSLASNW